MARAAPRRSSSRPAAETARKRVHAAAGPQRDSDPLALYRSKRAFEHTREPRGAPRERSAKGNGFVVQKHDATRLHYDFRLELDGVLLSWAVPKGPSLSPQDKRLAVQTEDHPVSYRDFEGAIPEGHYGAGDVIVWDRGTWTPLGDARAGLDKGHIDFELDGERLHGAFTLIRTRGGRGAKAARGPGSQWLLFKRSDAHARSGAKAEITQREQGSVITGKPLPARRRAPSKATPVARTPKRARPAAVPALDRIELQLATPVDRPPSGTQWVYEIKFDGYRLLASLDGDDVRLRSRNNLDWTRTFPAITAALQRLGLKRSVIDGELCYVTAQGSTSFQDLQRVLPRGGTTAVPVDQANLVFYVFDLLYHDGEDLREQPLTERKERLRALLEPPRRRSRNAAPAGPLAFSEHLAVDGAAALTQACRAGLEGLIAKRTGAPYRAGRSADWLKLKCRRRQEFVIAGMVAPLSGVRRSGFRSLILALHDEDGYRYCGKVGTGFDQAMLEDLSKRLQALAVDKPSVRNPPRERGLTWVRPKLVCEIDFAEFTREGLVRQASFQGLRLDKPAARVERERTRAVEDVVEEQDAAPRSRGSKRAAPAKTKSARKASPNDDGAVVLGVNISHPERVVDDPSGLTKLELARYHERVSEWMLPYVTDRFLALVRCPEGSASQCFFQKQKPRGVGASVTQRTHGGHEVLFARNARGIVELVQFNAIEFHGWGSRAGAPKRPDWIVMDLDPDPALPFETVIDAAFEVREALASVGLRSFVKTTGGKGLHVVAPLRPASREGWDTVKRFTHGMATALAARAPDRYVANMSKARRVGKIFVDYLRNGEGATAILPYSPRARPGATVAVPVSWDELRRIDPRVFTVREVGRWLGRRRRDPWAEFFDVKQSLPKFDDESAD
ncbi:MAG: ATP-dependent ligase [Panacagrimonas sp.]|nr:DNA ligase D [Panacagrimonas sp.]MCC2658062.1 ATP-dependent ligase [Panacagrimonas sp.]